MPGDTTVTIANWATVTATIHWAGHGVPADPVYTFTGDRATGWTFRVVTPSPPTPGSERVTFRTRPSPPNGHWIGDYTITSWQRPPQITVAALGAIQESPLVVAAFQQLDDPTLREIVTQAAFWDRHVKLAGLDLFGFGPTPPDVSASDWPAFCATHPDRWIAAGWTPTARDAIPAGIPTVTALTAEAVALCATIGFPPAVAFLP